MFKVPVNLFSNLKVQIIDRIIVTNGKQTFSLLVDQRKKMGCCDQFHTISISLDDWSTTENMGKIKANPVMAFFIYCVASLNYISLLHNSHLQDSDNWQMQLLVSNIAKIQAFLTEEEIEWLLNQQFNINEKPVWELPS